MTVDLEPEELRTLLAGLADPAVVTEVVRDRSAYAHTPVAELGVDSLAVMELACRIEALASREIDWDTFDLGEVATLTAIADLVRKLRGQR